MDWILSLIDKLDREENLFPGDSLPAAGICPLGTGNNLARIFGWHRTSNIRHFLAEIAYARPVYLDRWVAGTYVPKRSIRNLYLDENRHRSIFKDLKEASGTEGSARKSGVPTAVAPSPVLDPAT